MCYQKNTGATHYLSNSKHSKEVLTKLKNITNDEKNKKIRHFKGNLASDVIKGIHDFKYSELVHFFQFLNVKIQFFV